ncbi:hypothetical protein Dsin_004423 [Dipteronia sinensis]|uniref:GDSL esterase/lipase n=1 Tax=Dipteronia sinensis TaxID=43782 RepID=A0AAE0BAY8_9ROSI|nr:hypothetical protein Dsin_004423 [Dipteronia sinensis]
MASTNLLAIIFLQILMIINLFKIGNSKKLPSTILIFGDSTMDTGNNNYITTVMKANHPPYGQNFPGHIPTGRFSDGKLVPDFIASTIRIKEAVPPFLQPNLSDHELLSGVTFASAGSGWDDLTTLPTLVIPVSKQIDMFKDYIRRVKRIVGDDQEKANKIISGALVVISAGTNDFGLNFYGIPTRRFQFITIGAYQDFLLNKLQSFVEELHELGCRTMVIAGLPPMGCLPILQFIARFQNPFNWKCLENENSDARLYNDKLSKRINHLQALLPSSEIVYADIYEPMIDMIHYPHKYGFVETKRGCCGSGMIEAALLCNPTTPKCQNASQFFFWDSIHPSQSAYQFLTEHLVSEILPKLSFNQTS